MRDQAGRLQVKSRLVAGGVEHCLAEAFAALVRVDLDADDKSAEARWFRVKPDGTDGLPGGTANPHEPRGIGKKPFKPGPVICDVYRIGRTGRGSRRGMVAPSK